MEGLNCDKYKKSSKFWSRANKSSANKGKHVINVTAAFQNQQVYRMPWIVHTVHDLHWPVLECSRRGYLWGLSPPSLSLWSRVELQILAYLLLQSLLFFLLENPIKKWSLNLEVVFFFLISLSYFQEFLYTFRDIEIFTVLHYRQVCLDKYDK